MARYYFHLRTPDELERDEDGVDQPGVEAAYLEACRTIPGLCDDLLAEGKAPLACAFLICDEAGALLMEVPFSERLHDGRRPARPPPPGEPVDAASTVRQGRQLVAQMRAQIADMGANVSAARAAARQAWLLLRDDRVARGGAK